MTEYIHFQLWSKDGHVVVDIGRKWRYYYFADAALFPHLQKLSRRAPGRALNALKKVAHHYEKEEINMEKKNALYEIKYLERTMARGWKLLRQGKSVRGHFSECGVVGHRAAGVLFYRWVKRHPRYKRKDRLEVFVKCWKCRHTGELKVYDPKDYKQLPYHNNRLAQELNGLRYYHFK
jgi:hypothetical protein